MPLLRNQIVIIAFASIALLPSMSRAQLIESTPHNYAYNGGNNTAFSAISSTDLLETGSSAVSNVTFSKTANASIPGITTTNAGLTDGLSLVSGFGHSAYYGYNSGPNAKASLIVGDELAGGAQITFNLNTSVNTLGYTINSINSIAGWGDHASVANQNFTLAYSTVPAPNLFIPIASVAYDPNDPTADSSSGGGVASIVSFTGQLAGVAALQFDYTADPSSAGNGNSGTGLWLQEIDATGIATVPEPGTWAMIGLGVSALVFVLRARRLNA